MAFFPGTKGDKGDKGDPGPASTVPGPDGPAGAIGVYVGTFATGGTYYDNANRRDIVDYNGGFWITSNPAKNGLNTWSAPNVDDWAFFGSSLVNVATALRLLVPADIAVALNLQLPGFFKSDNFKADSGVFKGWALNGGSGGAGGSGGNFQSYDSILAGVFSTNSERFNLESLTRTMPAVGSAGFDIGAIVDGDIPVNPDVNYVTDDALIFFGWNQGANTYLENRFGNTSQKFDVSLNGNGENSSGGSDLFYIQLYYRTRSNGGAWGAWTVIGQDWYMNPAASAPQSFDLSRPLTLTLDGDNDVQFAAGFSKGASGTAAVSGAQISVRAYN